MLNIRICGIEFRLSLLFPAALVILFTIDQSGIVQWCVAASLLHEMGHFIMLYAVGSRPSQIIVGIFGVCVIQNPADLMSYRCSQLVALAGPLINLFTFGILTSLTGLSTIALINLTLAIFNLLPIEPLDGGQVLYYFFLQHFDETRAERFCLLISIAILAPMATAGFYLLIQSGYNFTLLAVSIYLGLLLLFKQKR